MEVGQLTLAVVGNMELCGCLTRGMQEGKIISGELNLQITQFGEKLRIEVGNSRSSCWRVIHVQSGNSRGLSGETAVFVSVLTRSEGSWGRGAHLR